MADEPKKGVRTYRDLVAWQLGMDLAQCIYRITGEFPDAERFGLTSQIRRSSVSVPANIAEGFGRGGKAEFRRFLEIARGSLFETQTHAELARRLGWVKGRSLTELRELAQRLDAVLTGLIGSIRTSGK
jgi:four helix bundle protein